MLNQVVLVGRLVKDPEIIVNESGKKFSNISIAIPRPYKNEEGLYDSDFIEVTLWNNIAENTAQYCKKGDIIAVKGRLQSSIVEKDEERMYVTKIVAEKITFLSSNKGEEKNETEVTENDN